MALKSVSLTSASHMKFLQRSFHEAILRFVLGPPEVEEKAFKRIMEIHEFVSKYKALGEAILGN